MLRDLGITVSPILALLLVVLTPFGTGQGAHRDLLLDPLFPHVHLDDNGPDTTAPGTAQRVLENPGHGPAVGAGAGADSASLSLGLTPPMPGALRMMPVEVWVWRIVPLDARPPEAFTEPPPDPPPTRA